MRGSTAFVGGATRRAARLGVGRVCTVGGSDTIWGGHERFTLFCGRASAAPSKPTQQQCDQKTPSHRAGARGFVVSRFTQTMYDSAQSSLKGMVTGEPNAPVRHTWRQVHERARRVAGGLAAAGVGHCDAVAVLAGAPVEIAPTAQGIWMRGGSLTMLHQPTTRTDLQRWAEETTAVINMIDAKAVVVSDPFMAAAPLMVQLGMPVLTIEQLLDSPAIDPVETDDADV